MKVVLSIITAVLFIVFAAVALPFVNYWCAYFGGWIASLTIGVELSNTLNDVFGVSYFTPEQIPAIAGLLGWVGGFFKASVIANEIRASARERKEH